MKNKRNIVLVIALIGLGVLLGMQIYNGRIPSPDAPYTERVYNLKPDTVNAITIRSKGEIAVLQREKDLWRINSKKARTNRVNDLLATLLPEKNPEIVAVDTTKHQVLGVNTDDAIVITLNGKPTFYFGKPTEGGVYVQVQGSDKVYVLPNSEASSDASIMLDFASLVDMTIFSSKPEAITAIQLKQNENELNLTKTTGKWVNKKTNAEISEDKISPFLYGVSFLKAHSFFQTESSTSYTQTPTLSLAIEYDGKQEKLDFFKGNTDYLVKRQSDKEQFVVGESDVSQLISASQGI